MAMYRDKKTGMLVYVGDGTETTPARSIITERSKPLNLIALQADPTQEIISISLEGVDMRKLGIGSDVMNHYGIDTPPPKRDRSSKADVTLSESQLNVLRLLADGAKETSTSTYGKYVAGSTVASLKRRGLARYRNLVTAEITPEGRRLLAELNAR